MRVVLVPGVPALLPRFAGLADPVADLRAACVAAVGWLGDDVEVLAADPLAAEVAAHLLGAPRPGGAGAGDLLVVGNGSACRSEKAPGHLDERSFGFDDAVAAWLTGTGPLPDLGLAQELQASLDAVAALAVRVPTLPAPRVDYDDDPFGVQYWVLGWEL